MRIKTFFSSNNKLNQIFINKYLIQKFYNKYFITKLYVNKWKKHLLVDTYSNQILVLSKIYKSLFLLRLLQRGCSLIADDFIYKYSNLQGFSYCGAGLKSKPSHRVTNFLNRLKNWTNKKEMFILYKVKRGGFLGLIRGLRGFVPLKHLLKQMNFFKAHEKCITFYNLINADLISSFFQTVILKQGGFHFNFNKALRKRRRFFLGAKLTFFFVYSMLINRWLKKFYSFKVNHFKNTVFLRLLFKKV